MMTTGNGKTTTTTRSSFKWFPWKIILSLLFSISIQCVLFHYKYVTKKDTILFLFIGLFISLLFFYFLLIKLENLRESIFSIILWLIIASPFIFVTESILFAYLETHLQKIVDSLDESCANNPRLTICSFLHRLQEKEIFQHHRNLTRSHFVESTRIVKGQKVQLGFIMNHVTSYLKQSKVNYPLVFVFAGKNGVGKDFVASLVARMINNETMIRVNCQGDCERDLGYTVFQTGLFNDKSKDEVHFYLYNELNKILQRNRNNDVIPVIEFDEFQYASEAQKSLVIPLINGNQFDPPISQNHLPTLTFKKTVIILNLNTHLLNKSDELVSADVSFDKMCNNLKEKNVEFSVSDLPSVHDLIKIHQDLAINSNFGSLIASHIAGKENERLIFDKTQLVLFCKHSRSSLESIFKTEVEKCVMEYKDKKKVIDNVSLGKIANFYFKETHRNEWSEKNDSLQFGSARQMSIVAKMFCDRLYDFFDKECDNNAPIEVTDNDTIICKDKYMEPVFFFAKKSVLPDLLKNG